MKGKMIRFYFQFFNFILLVLVCGACRPNSNDALTQNSIDGDQFTLEMPLFKKVAEVQGQLLAERDR